MWKLYDTAPESRIINGDVGAIWIAFEGGVVAIGHAVAPDRSVRLVGGGVVMGEPTHWMPLERPKHPASQE